MQIIVVLHHGSSFQGLSKLVPLQRSLLERLGRVCRLPGKVVLQQNHLRQLPGRDVLLQNNGALLQNNAAEGSAKGFVMPDVFSGP
jgi:hypothetical protein